MIVYYSLVRFAGLSLFATSLVVATNSVIYGAGLTWPAKGQVSLIALIANPREYHGTTLWTTGVAVVEFEEFMLYVGPNDATHHIFNNGVWLGLSREQARKWQHLNHKVVDVRGTYDFPAVGSYGMCPNGALIQITDMRERAPESRQQ